MRARACSLASACEVGLRSFGCRAQERNHRTRNRARQESEIGRGDCGVRLDVGAGVEVVLACAGEHACGDELGSGQARRTSCRKEVRGTGDTSLL